METKFVPLYREPRAVVLNETLGSYGEVMGVKKFENGFFALRYENGVILYDSAGQVVDTDLDDVFVFKFGYRLFKKINSSYWYLVDANGNPELCYVKCEAERFHLSGNVIALCDTDKTWRVFQLSNTAPKIEYILLSNPMAPFGSVDLQVFQNKNSDNFVVVFYRKDGSILLHYRQAQSTQVLKVVNGYRYCRYLANGCFVCAQAAFEEFPHEDGSIEIAVKNNGSFNLFDENLNVLNEDIERLLLQKDGSYLVNDAGLWKAYSADGTLLLS